MPDRHCRNTAFREPRGARDVWILSAAFLLFACGGASEGAISREEADYDSSGGEAPAEDYYPESVAEEEPMLDEAAPMAAPTEPIGGVAAFRGQVRGGPMLAQATPGTSASTTSTSTPSDTASDATDQPLVIYQAQLHLAVYDVESTQQAIVARVEELGGHLSRRTEQLLILRVPAAQFNAALGHTEEQGDVLHRDVTAQDVGEEYRDLEIRIRNLIVMRQRLEELLTRADDIQAALAIERELQRLTTEIERMRGRVRYLADQVSFSTITIHFQPKRDEDTTPDTFRLPFPWLNQLGLQRLMRL